MRLDSMSRRQREADFNAFSDFICKAEQRGAKAEKCDTGRHALAMVYPVKQEFSCIFDPEIGLINGTIFEELHKPFYKGGCCNKRQNGGEGCL